ncbi:MAG: hypothetical protein JSU68_03830, partial [Phycisphaerales bacterium]
PSGTALAETLEIRKLRRRARMMLRHCALGAAYARQYELARGRRKHVSRQARTRAWATTLPCTGRSGRGP